MASSNRDAATKATKLAYARLLNPGCFVGVTVPTREALLAGTIKAQTRTALVVRMDKAKCPAVGQPAGPNESPAKKSPVKKSPAKKSPAKKAPAKKAPAKKSPAKKAPAKKSPAKKSPAKKSPAKKSPAKKSR